MAVEVRIPTILRTYTGEREGRRRPRAPAWRADRRPRGQPPRHQGPADRGQATCAGSSTSTSTTRTCASSAASRPRSATATRSSCCPPSPAADPVVGRAGERRTFVLVDGENIDATLGNSLLRRRPQPEERPRWERVTEFADAALGPARHRAVLPQRHAAGSCRRRSSRRCWRMDYRADPAGRRRRREGRRHRHPAHPGRAARPRRRGRAAVQPRRRLRRRTSSGSQATAARSADRRCASSPAAQFTALGVPVFDLEDDVGAFNATLPRVRIIPLDEFDPEAFLR